MTIYRIASFLTTYLFSASISASPLQECYNKSDDRTDVSSCLDAKLSTANKDLTLLIVRMRAQLRVIDAASSTKGALYSFDASQHGFEAYRALNCEWHLKNAASGTGAGDFWKDCMIQMVKGRINELKIVLPDKP
ncbi:MAG: lysozyme inhibitor LprI family protein [Methylococcales bacterium]